MCPSSRRPAVGALRGRTLRPSTSASSTRRATPTRVIPSGPSTPASEDNWSSSSRWQWRSARWHHRVDIITCRIVDPDWLEFAAVENGELDDHSTGPPPSSSPPSSPEPTARAPWRRHPRWRRPAPYLPDTSRARGTAPTVGESVNARPHKWPANRGFAMCETMG
jgi:hypothetical protein